jgi:hypothetical protein
MRNVKNITVAVDPELYRRTRRLAAEYNTSVTDMVRFLLLVMPEALKSARYPGGRPQFGSAAVRARAALVASAAQPPAKPEVLQAAEVTSASMPGATTNTQAVTHPNSSPNSFPFSQIAKFSHTPLSFSNSSCKTVKATQTTSLQPLSVVQSPLLQFLHSSTLLITKILQAFNLIRHNE